MAKQKKELNFLERFFYSDKPKRKYAFGLVVFSLLLYLNTLPGNYNMDDELVTRDHRLTSKGIVAIPEIITSPYYSDDMGYQYDYRPLVLITFAIEHSIAGDNPHVSHFINVVLYALLCWLVFIWLSRMLTGYSLALAFIAAILFAAFPAHTEVVASIKNRDELLGFILAVLAARTALRTDGKSGVFWLLCVPLLFTAAMLGKTTMAPFAVIIPVSMVLFTGVRLRSALLVYFFQLIVVLLFASAKTVWVVSLLLLSGSVGLWLLHRLKNMGWKALYETHAEKVKNAFLQIAQFLKSDKANWDEQKPEGDFINKRPLFSRFNLIWLLLYALMGAFAALGFSWQNPLVIFVALLVMLLLHTRLPDTLLMPGLYVFAAVHGLYYFYLTPSLVLSQAPLMFALIVLTAYRKNRAVMVAGIIMLSALVLWDLLAIKVYWFMMVVPFLPLFNRKLIAFSFVGFSIYMATATWKIIGFMHGQTTDPLVYFAPLLLLPFYYLYMGGRWKPLWYGAILLLLGLQLYTGLNQYGYKNGPDLAYNLKLTIQRTASRQLKPATIARSERGLNFVEIPLDYHAPLKERAGTSLIVMGKYLKLLAIPYPLSFYYGYAEIVKTKWTDPVPLLVILLFSTALVFILWQPGKYPLLTFGLITVFISLLFFSNLFEPIAGMMADRYLFIPSLGLCLLLAAYFTQSFKAVKKNSTINPTYVLVLILLTYSFVTMARNAQWKDSVTLMRHDIKNVEESAQAHNLLANNLMIATDNEPNPEKQAVLKNEALIHFRKALQIYPKFFNVAYYLTKVYTQLGMTDSAIAACKKTIELDSTFYGAQVRMGDLLFAKGNYAGAVPYFAWVMNKYPDNYEGYDKLSFVYFKLNEFGKSIEVNKKAVQNLPLQSEPYINMGKTYQIMNKLDSARICYEQAFKISPANTQAQQLLNQANNR